MTSPHSELVSIHVPQAQLEGLLAIPDKASGLVLFAHGSGSGRLSPRNNFVAAELGRAGIGTLLLDLLSPQEDQDPAARFDIALLTRRLAQVQDWLPHHSAARHLALGLFGASTGAAAALRLAAEEGRHIDAVVSRGGRPDLAGPDALKNVRAPTLLIVGSRDDVVVDLNRRAYAALNCEKDLAIVPHATHLFEEPGALQEVAVLAAAWFGKHFTEHSNHLPRR